MPKDTTVNSEMASFLSIYLGEMEVDIKEDMEEAIQKQSNSTETIEKWNEMLLSVRGVRNVLDEAAESGMNVELKTI